jgi:hypothetical protein
MAQTAAPTEDPCSADLYEMRVATEFTGSVFDPMLGEYEVWLGGRFIGYRRTRTQGQALISETYRPSAH